MAEPSQFVEDSARTPRDLSSDTRVYLLRSDRRLSSSWSRRESSLDDESNSSPESLSELSKLPSLSSVFSTKD